MRDPQALMSTADLARLVGQPRLRVYDCTTYLETPPPGSDDPYIAVPGRRTFEEAHIPGADFLDLQGEFSDNGTRLRFMMPDPAVLEAAFGRHGIDADKPVILYSVGTMMWATRFWWMLRSLGHPHVAVLDGGFARWVKEGKPTTVDVPIFTPFNYPNYINLLKVGPAVAAGNTVVLMPSALTPLSSSASLSRPICSA